MMFYGFDDGFPPGMAELGTATPPMTKNELAPAGLSLGLQTNCTERRGVKRSSESEVINKESPSGSGSSEMGGNCSGDEHKQPNKKRYHRHTPQQIHAMESLFKECPHPDDKQRQELARELGLEPRQIKFWFQNRRTQMKAQNERTENNYLRMEIDRLSMVCEKWKEYAHELAAQLESARCSNCHGPNVFPGNSDLSIENVLLKKEQLDQCSIAAASFLRPRICVAAPQISGSAADSASPPAVMHPPRPGLVDHAPMSKATISDALKCSIESRALQAMQDLLSMLSDTWIPPPEGLREFWKCIPTQHKQMIKTDASQATGMVMMRAVDIVEHLMNSAKWLDIFPTIVSKADTIEVISCYPGTYDGTMLLMRAEMQMLSPMSQTREIYFVRYCKQDSSGTWVVVDASIDGLYVPQPASTRLCFRNPSGFIIHDMPQNGCAKVSVFENTEYDEQWVLPLFKPLVQSGGAFGAARWLATLQRQCEGLMYTNELGSTRDIPGPIINHVARLKLLGLSKRMCNTMYSVIGDTSVSWTTIAESGVRVLTRRIDPNRGEPHGLALAASITIQLPVPPLHVFDYIRAENVHMQYEVSQKIAQIGKSQAIGNDVSLYRVSSGDHESTMLEEASTDASGSLIVYAPLDPADLNAMLEGGDPRHVLMLPSAYVIFPDGSDGGGTLVTVTVQTVVDTSNEPKVTLQHIGNINAIILSLIQRVKSGVAQDVPATAY